MSALANATHDRKEISKGIATFEESCPSCRGSGVFRGYSGRIVGDCFKCKGTGKLSFRTAPETRAKAARSRAAKADQDRIEKAFATAQENGVKRPKMRLGEYKFSLAPATGRNAGALYVTRPSDDQYLGKIIGGKFTRVRECSEAAEAEIVALANDPHAASIAYGQRTDV